MESCELILDAQASLAEGPIWDERRQVLWWVDIIRGEVHRLNPASQEDRCFKTGEMVGAIALDRHGGLLLALASGLGRIAADALQQWEEDHIASPSLQVTSMPEILPEGVRFNDGKCDPAGRFWVGTIGGGAGSATLYCCESVDLLLAKKTGVTISNGLAWDEKAKCMYYIDTPTQSVAAFDYDADSCDIANERTAIAIDVEDGAPDGMTIDTDGMLWIALWGGSAVGRWNPKTGELIQKIAVPALNVTSCIFGGPDYRSLYITTAQAGLDEDALSAYPRSGGLFRLSCTLAGRPTPTFAG